MQNNSNPAGSLATPTETTLGVKRLAEIRRGARQRSAFETWAWSPVIVLRIALVAIYVAYSYAGIVALIAGVPLFNVLNFTEGYTAVWGALITLSALLCTLGATSDKYSPVEKWASMGLTCLMSAYVIGMNIVAYAELDLDRMFVGAVAFMAWVLPATRFGYLAAQTGKKHG